MDANSIYAAIRDIMKRPLEHAAQKALELLGPATSPEEFLEQMKSFVPVLVKHPTNRLLSQGFLLPPQATLRDVSDVVLKTLAEAIEGTEEVFLTLDADGQRSAGNSDDCIADLLSEAPLVLFLSYVRMHLTGWRRMMGTPSKDPKVPCHECRAPETVFWMSAGFGLFRLCKQCVREARSRKKRYPCVRCGSLRSRVEFDAATGYLQALCPREKCHRQHRRCRQCELPLEAARKCGRCRQPCYCSPDCQRADWPRHKQECS
jgi:hypothetical protein